MSLPDAATAFEHGHPQAGVHVVVRNTERVYVTNTGMITACTDVNLEARPGEFVVIVGPSGCGKSTLLRMIAGLDSPSSGSISLSSSNGHVPTNSMVFHGRTLFPWLNLRANVAYGLKMRGVDRVERERIADSLLDTVGLAEFTTAWPHELSEGMRQRVSLARALATDPDLLLMDEPFGALDEQTRFILQEELLALWQNTGKTVIFVTHSIEEALMLGDRVLIMTARPGTIAANIPVPFPRPRSLADIRSHAEFGPLFEEIWRTLRVEVERGGAFT